jgi:hypothetical protein
MAITGQKPASAADQRDRVVIGALPAHAAHMRYPGRIHLHPYKVSMKPKRRHSFACEDAQLPSPTLAVTRTTARAQSNTIARYGVAGWPPDVEQRPLEVDTVTSGDDLSASGIGNVGIPAPAEFRVK